MWSPGLDTSFVGSKLLGNKLAADIFRVYLRWKTSQVSHHCSWWHGCHYNPWHPRVGSFWSQPLTWALHATAKERERERERLFAKPSSQSLFRMSKSPIKHRRGSLTSINIHACQGLSRHHTPGLSNPPRSVTGLLQNYQRMCWAE